MWFDEKGIAALDTEPADLSTFHSPALSAQDQTEDDISQMTNMNLDSPGSPGTGIVLREMPSENANIGAYDGNSVDIIGSLTDSEGSHTGKI